MYDASDLRKGLKIEIDGAPYVITDFNFVKPGKGAAIYTCKLKNLANGATMTKAYRNNDTVDQPQLTEKHLHFSYSNGSDYVFLDENFEEVVIEGAVMGDSRHFMAENISVDVLFHNGLPIEVTLPNFVEKEVTYTEPGVRGDTATNVQKPATLEGGYQLQVPLFVNQGDLVKIDTRTGEYVDRVPKK